MGVFILLRPIGEFKEGAVGDIVHRINLVTGIVTADNGDKSYAVEIGESGKSIKKIFTLSPDPDLRVGDKARVLYRGGNKEDMILLAPTKPAVISVPFFIFVTTYTGEAGYPYYVTVLDENGEVLTTFNLESGDWINDFDCTCCDASGNYYVLVDRDKIRKYSSEGSLLLTSPNITHYVYGIAIDPDGYVWVQGYYDTWNNGQFVKLDPDTLEKISAFDVTDDSYYGFVIDSGGYGYVVSFYTPKGVEKWNMATGAQVATRDLGSGNYTFNSLARAGDYLFSADFIDHIWQMNKDLGSAEENWPRLDGLRPFGFANIGNDFVVQGRHESTSNILIGRYQSDKTKVWLKDLLSSSHVSSGICTYSF